MQFPQEILTTNDAIRKLAENSSDFRQFDCRHEITSENVEAFAKNLKINKTLTYLHLDTHGLNTQELTSISEALREHLIVNQNLRRLILSDDFNSHDLNIICQGLRQNHKLADLDLTEIEADSIVPLLETFEHMKLDSVRIFGNKLNEVQKDEFTDKLASLIKLNTPLTSITLELSLSSKGMHKLIDALKLNNKITRFDYRYKFITAEDAKALASLLESNTPLSELHLGELSQTAAEIIAGSLLKNTNITTVLINGNSDPESPTSFAHLLRQNKSITQFIHWGANLPLQTAHTFATSLRQNNTLIRFDIHADVDEKLMTEFADLLEVNTTLQLFNVGKRGLNLNDPSNFQVVKSRIDTYLQRNGELARKNNPHLVFKHLLYKHFAIFNHGAMEAELTLEFLEYFKMLPEVAEFKDYVAGLELYVQDKAKISSPQGKQEIAENSKPAETITTSSAPSVGTSLGKHGLFKTKDTEQELTCENESGESLIKTKMNS